MEKYQKKSVNEWTTDSLDAWPYGCMKGQICGK